MKRAYLTIRDLAAGDAGTQMDHFHLRMSEGDFVELLGTEGSGKAQLAAVLTGRARIREGSVWIADRTYGPGDSIDSTAVRCVGSTPSLVRSLTVAENIVLLARGRKSRFLLRRQELVSRASFLLSEFGIPLRADMKAEGLSSGEERAVELLRAVEDEIPFLLIGDIFGRTGQADLQMIESVLRKMKARGTTILVLGSSFPRFIDLDDRVEVIRRGRHVRTFYRENYDRETYVKWFLGTEDPAMVRAQASGFAGGRNGAFIAGGDKGGGDPSAFRLQIRGLVTPGLTGIGLTAAAGEIVGLYDMNNRGNRELVQCLTGDMRPLGGEMYLDAERYAPDGALYRSRRGVDFLPRNILDCAVVEGMDYAENVELSTMRRGSRFGFLVNRRVQNFLASEYGAELDEKDPKRAKGGDLSADDRMRTALQRILLHRPKLLIIEDVLSDMNINLLRLETEYFRRLTDAGCTILISSQNLTALRQVADRIVILHSDEST